MHSGILMYMKQPLPILISHGVFYVLSMFFIGALVSNIFGGPVDQTMTTVLGITMLAAWILTYAIEVRLHYVPQPFFKLGSAMVLTYLVGIGDIATGNRLIDPNGSGDGFLSFGWILFVFPACGLAAALFFALNAYLVDEYKKTHPDAKRP